MEPTILDPNEFAIVTVDGCSNYEILMPQWGAQEVVPPLAVFLMACAMRLDDDPEFGGEMLDWFENKQGKDDR